MKKAEKLLKNMMIVVNTTRSPHACISRESANDLLKNVRSANITFDFKNVQSVGQGFVDQVFRVWQHEHPDTKISYKNANDDVTFMIERGLTEL